MVGDSDLIDTTLIPLTISNHVQAWLGVRTPVNNISGLSVSVYRLAFEELTTGRKFERRVGRRLAEKSIPPEIPSGFGVVDTDEFTNRLHEVVLFVVEILGR